MDASEVDKIITDLLPRIDHQYQYYQRDGRGLVYVEEFVYGLLEPNLEAFCAELQGKRPFIGSVHPVIYCGEPVATDYGTTIRYVLLLNDSMVRCFSCKHRLIYYDPREMEDFVILCALRYTDGVNWDDAIPPDVCDKKRE